MVFGLSIMVFFEVAYIYFNLYMYSDKRTISKKKTTFNNYNNLNYEHFGLTGPRL